MLAGLIVFPMANEGTTDVGEGLLQLTFRRMENQLAGYHGAEYLKEKAIFESGVLQTALTNDMDRARRTSGGLYYRLQMTVAYWLYLVHAY